MCFKSWNKTQTISQTAIPSSLGRGKGKVVPVQNMMGSVIPLIFAWALDGAVSGQPHAPPAYPPR